jgi:parallel beta helix pectate lyase-like protein
VHGGATTLQTVYVDSANTSGWAGSTIDAWMGAASASLGAPGGTIQVAAGSYTIAASIQAATNVSIQCDPGHGSILTASATLVVPLYVAASVSNFRLSNCVLDGDYPANTYPDLFMASLTNATGGTISNTIMRNTIGFGVYLYYGNTYISIFGNEIYNFGPVLPGITIAIGAGAQSAGGNSHIAVLNNYIHDGSLGIVLQPSTMSSNLTEDWEITGNTITKMASNGVTIYCVGLGTSGPVKNVRTLDNEVSCVGWPPNGSGFDPACTPGPLQTGSVGAADGTGVSYNCAAEEQGVIANNRLHDNYFEGIDVFVATNSYVNTGTGGGCGGPNALCWVSGDLFQYPLWKPHQTVFINNNAYELASCSSSTSCTLASGPGNLTDVQMFGNAMRSLTTVTGNLLYNNGHGNGIVSGNGGADVTGYEDTWASNVSYENNAYGFVDQGAVLTTHTGDITYNNGLSGVLHDGIECTGCLNPRWLGIQGYDTSAIPIETTVARFDGTTYGGYMCNIIAIGTINAFIDDGTDDVTNCGDSPADSPTPRPPR